MTPEFSKNILTSFNRFLEQRMFLVIFSGILLGWFVPAMESWKTLVPLLFGYMTFATALSISWKGLLHVIKTPGPILLIIALLHIVMPIFAWALAPLVLGSESPFTVGMVLAVIIPIGVTSVIWTSLARGESPLALSAVSIDSLLSPFVVPFSVQFLLGTSVQFDSGSLMKGLFWMIVFPTIIGVTLHDITQGEIGPKWAPINGPFSKVSLSLVVAVNVAAAKSIITGMQFSIVSLLILLLVQAFAGYILGYGAGRFLQYSPERSAALTFCVGMRNISAGVVIALQYFSPQATVPVVLAMLFQQPLASLFHRWVKVSSTEN